MKTLLREISIPFRGGKETALLFLAGSRVIASFLLRAVGRAVKRGWAAAMQIDTTPPAAPAKNASAAKAADAGGAEHGNRGTGADEPDPKTAKKTTKKANGTPADDAIERIGAGCLIVLFAAVVTVGLIWLAVWFGWPYVAPYAQWIVGGLAVVWIIAAWTVAPPREEATAQNDHEKSAGEQHQEPDHERATRDLIRFIVAAVIAADAEGHKGVHVAELLQRLQGEAQGFDTWDVAGLRGWCTAAGIPVNKNVRAKGKGPTWGVRSDELQQAFGTPLNQALEALSLPAAPGPAGGAPAAPVPAPDSTPAAPLAPPPAQAPAPAAETAPLRRHLQAVSDPSPEAVA
ncbi:hypothetical protein [Streptomyces sp. NPDC004296]|uniref:hypothetical protein n=1 Tax=Streptomyces sp. NPDC004296 TaxID=3364697 RepID=UPI0036771041